MTTTLIGKRLYDWDGPGKAGVVTDTHFIRCFWPHLTEPTRIFAEGSSGLIVQGPPTPRNVIFPDDTVFPEVFLDADSAAVAEAMRTSRRRGLVNATPEMVEAYLLAYATKSAALPPTAAKHRCRDDCHFLVHYEGKERYIAELTKQEAVDLCDGVVVRETLSAAKDYVRTSEPGSAKRYSVTDNVLSEKVG